MNKEITQLLKNIQGRAEEISKLQKLDRPPQTLINSLEHSNRRDRLTISDIKNPKTGEEY